MHKSFFGSPVRHVHSGNHLGSDYCACYSVNPFNPTLFQNMEPTWLVGSYFFHHSMHNKPNAMKEVVIKI